MHYWELNCSDWFAVEGRSVQHRHRQSRPWHSHICQNECHLRVCQQKMQHCKDLQRPSDILWNDVLMWYDFYCVLKHFQAGPCGNSLQIYSAWKCTTENSTAVIGLQLRVVLCNIVIGNLGRDIHAFVRGNVTLEFASIVWYCLLLWSWKSNCFAFTVRAKVRHLQDFPP